MNLSGARLEPSPVEGGAITRSYVIAGIPCLVTCPPSILEAFDSVYGTDRAELVPPVEALSFLVEPDGSGYLVYGPDGVVDRRADESRTAGALLNRLGSLVVDRLADRGTYAIHAASLRHGDGVVIVSGRSGAGKTTLALGLVRSGLRLLSDEYALAGPDARTILPFQRALQVRPGTPELITELSFLTERPLVDLGGGVKWTLGLADLEQAFPGSLAGPAPLRHVVLIGERAGDGASSLEPVTTGFAAVELVRATPAAAESFTPSLERIGGLLAGCRCARLHPGSLESSVELLLGWLGPADG